MLNNFYQLLTKASLVLEAEDAKDNRVIEFLKQVLGEETEEETEDEIDDEEEAQQEPPETQRYDPKSGFVVKNKEEFSQLTKILIINTDHIKEMDNRNYRIEQIYRNQNHINSQAKNNTSNIKGSHIEQFLTYSIGQAHGTTGGQAPGTTGGQATGPTGQPVTPDAQAQIDNILKEIPDVINADGSISKNEKSRSVLNNTIIEALNERMTVDNNSAVTVKQILDDLKPTLYSVRYERKRINEQAFFAQLNTYFKEKGADKYLKYQKLDEQGNPQKGWWGKQDDKLKQGALSQLKKLNPYAGGGPVDFAKSVTSGPGSLNI